MSQDLSQKMATFIKEKRIALGMTQRQFALYVFQDIGSHSYISKIENGKRGITLETAGKILEALNSEMKIVEH